MLCAWGSAQSNRSSNSVYPLSFAARKNACKVEWWLSGSAARTLPALSRHSLELCGWHLTTRDWPVIALHHYGMEPKSTRPSRMGVQCGFTGLAALTAAAK